MSKWMRCLVCVILGLLPVVTLAAGGETVRIALDWTPNTNHTGILVAHARGYFEQEGLAVEVIEAGPGLGVHLAVSGQCEFAVSMQEEITMARGQGMPIVSVAAIYPHNTTGFAAEAVLGVESPAAFEGLRYGGWGQDFERAIIRTVMEAHGADVQEVTMVDLGMLDFATALRRGFADVFWIFYGWQGIQAELLGIEISYLPLVDLSDALDYYTPVIAASETMLSSRPDTVARFLRALARGYIYAAQHPEAAAEHLLDFAPELDRTLVLASQRWLADHMVLDLEVWGWQRPETWRTFAEWAAEHQLIDELINPEDAYTNRHLPGWEAP